MWLHHCFRSINPFDKNRSFYHKSIDIAFPEPTDSAVVMNRALMQQMHELFSEGVEFKNVGLF